MSSNLPPGVTESMIPGNRPEDLKEEAFWEELIDRVEKDDLLKRHLPENWDEAPVYQALIEIVRNMAYCEGLHDGIVEEQMYQMAAEDCPQCGYAHKDNDPCVVD